MNLKEKKKFIKPVFVFLVATATFVFGGNMVSNSTSPDRWWKAGTFVLGVGIVSTIIPIIWGFLIFTNLHDPGNWFDTSDELSAFRSRLVSHYSRITGTLKYWKSKASAHNRLYSAQVIWATLSSVVLPVLVQFFDKTTNWPTIFLTILTTWNGVLLALTYILNSRELYRGFRQQESDFYDESRRLLNEAKSDDPNLEEKIEEYIRSVASIRRVGRRVETGTPPSALDR